MRRLYLLWRFGGVCPYRARHNLDAEFKSLDEPLQEEWGLAGRRTVDRRVPRPPRSHRTLRNVLVGFAHLAEEEELERAAAGMGA